MRRSRQLVKAMNVAKHPTTPVWFLLFYCQRFGNKHLCFLCFASLVAQCVSLQCARPRFDPWVAMILWRRKRQPTPVLLSGKFHGQGSLVGNSPWDRKESRHNWATSLFPCKMWKQQHTINAGVTKKWKGWRTCSSG